LENLTRNQFVWIFELLKFIILTSVKIVTIFGLTRKKLKLLICETVVHKRDEKNCLHLQHLELKKANSMHILRF